MVDGPRDRVLCPLLPRLVAYHDEAKDGAEQTEHSQYERERRALFAAQVSRDRAE